MVESSLGKQIIYNQGTLTSLSKFFENKELIHMQLINKRAY